jgi:IS605 OrfB family transposase
MSKKLTIPSAITRITPEEETQLLDLFRRFGNARRRAYMLYQRGASKAEIERLLQEQIGINSRYAKDAYNSIEYLPPHVTFGGFKLQKLRETGKISAEEYRNRRNALIISRGDKTKCGNLNARMITNTDGRFVLRINVPPDNRASECRWIYPEIFIPDKYVEHYGHLLKGKTPYTVLLKRKDNEKRYDVRIVIEVTTQECMLKEIKRVMALDVNAGHIDFAVADKVRVLAIGKINCHEVQYVSASKTSNLLHKTANKIWNIAEHYGARVVYGKLSTSKFKTNHKTNRKVGRIPHHKLGSILEYKCGAMKRSEANTTKIGEKVSPIVGLDVHKCSATAFALKVLHYEGFRELIGNLFPISCSSSDETIPRGALLNEGNGSPRRRLSVGSGLTALHPDQLLVHDEVAIRGNGGYSIAPGIRGLSFMESLKTSLPVLDVRIC